MWLPCCTARPAGFHEAALLYNEAHGTGFHEAALLYNEAHHCTYIVEGVLADGVVFHRQVALCLLHLTEQLTHREGPGPQLVLHHAVVRLLQSEHHTLCRAGTALYCSATPVITEHQTLQVQFMMPDGETPANTERHSIPQDAAH